MDLMGHFYIFTLVLALTGGVQVQIGFGISAFISTSGQKQQPTIWTFYKHKFEDLRRRCLDVRVVSWWRSWVTHTCNILCWSLNADCCCNILTLAFPFFLLIYCNHACRVNHSFLSPRLEYCTSLFIFLNRLFSLHWLPITLRIQIVLATDKIQGRKSGANTEGSKTAFFLVVNGGRLQ